MKNQAWKIISSSAWEKRKDRQSLSHVDIREVNETLYAPEGREEKKLPNIKIQKRTRGGKCTGKIPSSARNEDGKNRKAKHPGLTASPLTKGTGSYSSVSEKNTRINSLL